ncbi:MAG TPA: acetyl-CoA carboxylase, biotin carboxyl carrier protein, partial [Verrucomicrobiae bacterium]|nr:acetyl-CoA carboxylase, biotin carboxyl carrier protein [Verrucomicrobiae bacterium]
MDLKDIKAIVDLMKKNSISEFELEKQEFKIRLKRTANGGAHGGIEEASSPIYLPAGTLMPAQVGGQMSAQGGAQHGPAASPSNEIEIKSPMVGTFYRAPSPEAANYIEIGAEVHPDTVVCI